MSSLNKFKPTTDTVEETDSIGANALLDSNVYLGIIELAYLNVSAGGATSLNVNYNIKGKILKSTMWITSGKAKGCKTTYTNKNGKEVHLPGFSIANHICLLTAGVNIYELDTEKKVIKLYNYEAKKDIPTEVECLTPIMGKEIQLGVIRQIVDKNVKTDSGQYVPSGDTREENEVDKIFQAGTGRTVVEIKAEENAVFIDTWKNKWTDVVRNKAKGAKQTGGTAGMPTPTNTPAGNASSTPSLFATPDTDD